MGISLWFSATFVKENKFSDFLFALPDYEDILNPFALRKAKIVYSFGLSDCNRVKRSLQLLRLLIYLN